MHIGEIDWGAIGTFVTKGVETAGQIQAQRFAQQNQALQMQIAQEQARVAQQMQLAQLVRNNDLRQISPSNQNSQLGPYNPTSPALGHQQNLILGIRPLYLIAGTGALILLIFLMTRK